jgi:hypothetical protein
MMDAATIRKGEGTTQWQGFSIGEGLRQGPAPC